jgi:predicted secreted Zn-dependent protease
MIEKMQALKITETICVGTFKVEVSKELKAEVVKYNNGELRVRYSMPNNASYLTPPVPKEYTKTVWQKAQQQQ